MLPHLRLLIYFIGKRNLFKDDLFIKKGDDKFWSGFENKFAVIKLDFSKISESRSIQEFEDDFRKMLLTEALRHNIRIEINTPRQMLENLAHSLSLKHSKSEQAKEKVVILIDEYDAPLNSTMEEEELFKDIHKELRNFYSMVKSLDGYLRFVFITGIVKFSQTSIFSGSYITTKFIILTRNEQLARYLI